MRVFITSCVAAAVIAVVSALVLDTLQKPVQSAFATSSARVGSEKL